MGEPERIVLTTGRTAFVAPLCIAGARTVYVMSDAPLSSGRPSAFLGRFQTIASLARLPVIEPSWG
jgi:hypothetical protein